MAAHGSQAESLGAACSGLVTKESLKHFSDEQMEVVLKPYEQMKDSGVEWLGEVPEHWDVRRLGNSASVLNGATPSTNNSDYWDGDLLWLTPEDLGKLNSPRISNSARKITPEGHASCGTSIAPTESVALSTRAPIGHLGILATAGCTNQ